MLYTAKDAKNRMKEDYNKVLNMTDKEFFELKRKLFQHEAKKDKYTLEDIRKMAFAKLLIDIGFMPQKAIDKLEEKWDDKIDLIDEMLEITDKNIKHLEDILSLLKSVKSLEEIGLKIIPIEIEGMGEYGKKISNDIERLLNDAETKIEEDSFLDQLTELLKKAVELVNEKIELNTIKANAYVIDIERVLSKALGKGIKKYMISLYSLLRGKEIKGEINNKAKTFDSDDRDFDYADYIATLIIVKYYKELSEKTYSIINQVIDCEPYDISMENVREHIIGDNDGLNKCKKEIVNLLNEYYPVFDEEIDIPIILNSIYSSTQTFMFTDIEATENDKEFINELKSYSISVLIAKIVFEMVKHN